MMAFWVVWEWSGSNDDDGENNGKRTWLLMMGLILLALKVERNERERDDEKIENAF